MLSLIPARAYLYAMCAALICLGAAWFYHHAQRIGAERVIQQQNIDLRRRTDAATTADDAARRCTLDSDCLMRDDGYKRR